MPTANSLADRFIADRRTADACPKVVKFVNIATNFKTKDLQLVPLPKHNIIDKNGAQRRIHPRGFLQSSPREATAKATHRPRLKRCSPNRQPPGGPQRDSLLESTTSEGNNILDTQSGQTDNEPMLEEDLPREPDTPTQPAELVGDMESKKPLFFALLGSNIFALFMDGLYEYLSLRGVVSMKLAWVVLVFVWAIGVVAICASEWILRTSIKHKFRWGALASAVLALLLFGFHEGVSWLVRPPVSLPVPSIPAPPGPQVNVNGDCSVGSVGSGNTISTDCSKGSKEKRKRE